MGKSTLFNFFSGFRRAIVADYPGVTRDTISMDLGNVVIFDTPGLDLLQDGGEYKNRDSLREMDAEILKKSKEIIDQSDMALLVLEYPYLQPYDYELAGLLRKQNLPTMVVVNKVDHSDAMEGLADFFELGFNDMVPISLKNRWNLQFLQDQLAYFLERNLNWQWLLPKDKGKKSQALAGKDPSIAIVGRPNAGKSTLLNRLLDEERALVSDVPGTTRDSIDSSLKYYGKNIIITDTAGIRKSQRRGDDPLEKFSFFRTEDAVKNSHAVLHVLDAQDGITDTDKKILDLSLRHGKQVLFVINKWDLMGKDAEPDKYFKQLQGKFPLIQDYPYITISAKDGKRVSKLLDTIISMIEEAGSHVSTAKLNQAFQSILASRRIVSTGGKFKIYYLTQVGIYPPTFVAFVNNPSLIKKNSIKYIERLLKDNLGFKHSVLRLVFRGRDNKLNASNDMSKDK